MDMDVNNENEPKLILNILIYAVDECGICHLFQNETFNELSTIPNSIEENIYEQDVSKSIAVLLNQIDNYVQMTNKSLIENSSNFGSADYFSTQPFSILNLQENYLSSLNLFNNDISVPVHSPPLKFSGQIVPQYPNDILIINNELPQKKQKKKKKKSLNYRVHRSSILKKQLKSYLRKKKRKQQKQKKSNESHVIDVSNVIVHHEPQQIESTSMERSTTIDFQLPPDLSKPNLSMYTTIIIIDILH
ncbi:unnamed protein product [Rotaria socialis]